MSTKKRDIEIKCKGSRLERFGKLKVIQGSLKDLSPENMAKLRRRIEIKGFDAPFFVWDNNILDGTQRYRVLQAMLKDGWRLPAGKVPVCDIQADSLDQAKDRLLGYISQYGKVTEAGLAEFVGSIEAADLDSLSIQIETPELLETIGPQAGDLPYREFKLKPYRRTHVLLSFPPELFGVVREHLEKIIAVEGVEYEQGSN